MLNHFLLSLLLGAAVLPALAQTAPVASAPAPGALAPKASYQFCVLEATQVRTSKLSFVLDYGPKSSTQKPTETEMYAERWKVEALASLADALNFMTAKGWEFVSSNAVLTQQGIVQYQYVFRQLRATP